MTDDEIRAEVTGLAGRELKLPGPLPETGDLAEHLDSVQRLTLIVAIEDRFGIAFDPDDEDGVRTLDDVVRLIRRKQGGDDARG